MTVTESRVGSSLLYVAIDLGPEPTMQWFGEQVGCVNALWRHCVHLVLDANSRPASPTEQLVDEAVEFINPKARPFLFPDDARLSAEDHRRVAERTHLLISRTSLASPWVSVLTTVAEKSAPVGYGLAALFAMQRLLNMIITWQRHRLEIQQAKAGVLHGHGPIDLLTEHAAGELTTHARYPSRDPQNRSMSFPLQETVQAAEHLAPVLEAEMVDENDPRVRGEES